MQAGQDRLWLALSPLLVLYAISILILHPQLGPCQGDEGRYLDFAKNLLHGYYSPPDQVDLWNGPGYPILLAPVAWSQHALLIARLLNALLLFAALVYLRQALAKWMSARRSLMFTVLFGLYPPLLRYMPYALTETFSILLVCGLAYHILTVFEADGRRRLIHATLSSLFIAWLALTKVFFGVVLTALLIVATIAWLLMRSRVLRTTAGMLAVAFLLCTPWLFYTWNLTGRVMYWSTAGGSTLYWMSSPYAEESGDWFGYHAVMEGNNPVLHSHHHSTYEDISLLPAHEADRVLVRKAMDNIRQHPGKYLRNWGANVGRLLFNYPYSYTPQSATSLFYIVPNSVLLSFALMGVWLSIMHRRQIPAGFWFLLAFFSVSFAGSSLVSAYGRMFVVLTPALYIVAACNMARFVDVRTP